MKAGSKKLIASLAGAGVGVSALCVGTVPASAAGTDMSVTILAGARTVALTDTSIAFGSINYSLTDRTVYAGSTVDGLPVSGVPFTVGDMTGSDAGWVVSAEVSSDLTGSGSATISKDNVGYVPTDSTIGPGDGAQAGAMTGVSMSAYATSLGQSGGAVVASADDGQGAGQYKGRLGLSLVIPGKTPADTYSGTVVVTIAPSV